jgi:hypothetical protein
MGQGALIQEGAMRYLTGIVVLAVALLPRTAAADNAAVEQAIGRGVDALRKMQNPDGMWEYSTEATSVGATALAGLTLVECGADKDDPAVSSAARFVRVQAVRLRFTYSVALSIVFLDRLGDSADEALISSLTARLAAGQLDDGTWDYNCPDASQLDEHMLLTALQQQQQRVNGRGKDAAPKADNPGRDFMRRVGTLRQQRGGPGRPQGIGDNSLTQFATLALWVAHRHGLPVESSLRLVDQHFRSTQNPDGGWSYLDHNTHLPSGGDAFKTRPTMICAGLFGVGVGYGVEAKKDNEKDKAKAARNPNKDRVLQAGLRELARSFSLPRTALSAAPVMRGAHRVRQHSAGGIYYFLWGLERVAVTLDLKKIGNIDWYNWGCSILLESQQTDGSWAGAFADGGVDTSFALLFLKKANLVGDLTTLLRGKVQDVGPILLKSGEAGSVQAAAPKSGDAAIPTSGEASTKTSDAVPDPGRAPASAAKPGSGAAATKHSDPVADSRAPASPAKPASGNSPSKHSDALPDPGRVTTSQENTSHLGDTPSAKLADALLALSADRQVAEIERLRDQKGPVHTEALAAAIPYLSPEPRRKAREALAARVARMKAETIADYLHDEEPEIRRAAALACALKGTKHLVPQLIALLTDREQVVARAAYAALREMTGQDFGPDPSANDADRKRAAAAWNDWWKTQSP